jgi:Tol biopolymer transport system component/beta-lactamase regulating signal transducer with metallopeptidase domain
MLPHVFETAFFSKLSIALLHFLWQGLIFALCALLLLLLLRRKSAAARYLALLAVLGGMAICPVATFFLLPNQTLPPQEQLEHFQLSGNDKVNPNAAGTQLPSVTPAMTTSTAASSLIETTTAEPSPAPLPASSWQVPLHRIRIWLGDHLLWTAVLWLAGVALMLGRFLFGLFALARCQRRGLQPISDALAERFAYLAKRLAVTRPVRLLISSLVQVPTVIGWLRPVILLPASALTGLAPVQLEAILAHELAHIRRRDYLVNLFQILVETLLFYHPAVWWVSNRLREEREHCCDDLVVGLGGSPLVYVKALTRLAEIGPELPHPALAGTGGKLLTRIRRLSGLAPARLDLAVSWPEGIVSLICLLGIGLLVQIQTSRALSGDFTPASPFELVSVSSAVSEPSGGSIAPVISGNGRFITFCSRASNLVPGDNNGKYDVFVYARETGKIECISTDINGRAAPGDSGWIGDDLTRGDSFSLAISDEGRYVAFVSNAPLLAPGTASGEAAIYVRDRQENKTESIKLANPDKAATYSYGSPGLSGSGEIVLFYVGVTRKGLADSNASGFYCFDRPTGVTAQIKGTGKYSGWRAQEATISADGRFIAFWDRRTEVAGGKMKDVMLLLDRKNGQTTLLAETTADEESLGPPQISADGSLIIFSRGLQGNFQPYLYDRVQGALLPLKIPGMKDRIVGRIALSADGRFLALVGIQMSNKELMVQNAFSFPTDLYWYDRKGGRPERIAEGRLEGPWIVNGGNLSISNDGRCVAYDWGRDQRWLEDRKWDKDIYLYDRPAKSGKLVSAGEANQPGNSWVRGVSICANGRFVAFCSDATNLAPGWPVGKVGVFIRDRKEGRTEAVSINNRGEYCDTGARHPSLSADGRFVAFTSDASNLVETGSSEMSDIFVRDRLRKITERVSVGPRGETAEVDFPSGQPTGSDYPAVSADGRFVAFASLASNLVPGDTNHKWDIFVRDRELGRTERISVNRKGREANGDSASPFGYNPELSNLAISPEGRFVVFTSRASNLVPNDTNDAPDIFLRDRKTGTTELVSLDVKGRQWAGGAYHPALSDDGRFIAFTTLAQKITPGGDTFDLGEVFLRDRLRQTTEKISIPPAEKPEYWNCRLPSLSGDGKLVAFAANEHCFIRDREQSKTYAVKNGSGYEPMISADGRFIACRISHGSRPDEPHLFDEAAAVLDWRKLSTDK